MNSTSGYKLPPSVGFYNLENVGDLFFSPANRASSVSLHCNIDMFQIAVYFKPAYVSLILGSVYAKYVTYYRRQCYPSHD